MDETKDIEEPVSTDALLFLRSLRVVLGRIPLWLVTWAGVALLAFAVAVPRYGWFAGATENRYAPGSLVHSLDENFRQDHGGDLSALDAATASYGAILFLLAGLIGVFAAGGWLQVILERTYGQSLRRFFYGGSRYFWRFFRFWILSLLVLACLHWVVYGWPWETLVLQLLLDVPKEDFTRLETLESEAGVRWLGWVQHGLAAVGFVLVLAWGSFGRTRLALHDTSSAIWAGLCSAFTVLRHPVKTLRPLVFLMVLELIVVTLVAGGVTRWLDGGLAESPSLTTIVLMLLIGQVALMWREITRGAGYYAAVQVSREVVRPLSRPDPWKAIGGPGGPQYPVDGEDEYGVAL